MAYDDPDVWTDTPGVPSGGLGATNEVNADRMNKLEQAVVAAASIADAAVAGLDDATVTAESYTDAQIATLGQAVAAMLGRPSAPTNLTVTDRGVTTITVQWTASVPAGGLATSYRVYVNGTQVATGVTATSYQVTGLTTLTSYDFYVVPYNTNGDGIASASISAQTLNSSGLVPAAPLNLEATWSDVQVDLTWDAVTSPSGPLSGYKVFRNGTQIATTTSLSYSDTGRTASTTYTYTVKAYNSSGDSPASDALTLTTNATLTAPGVRGGFGTAPSTTSGAFTTTMRSDAQVGDIAWAVVSINNAASDLNSVSTPGGAWTLVEGPVRMGTTMSAWLLKKQIATADIGATVTVSLTSGGRESIAGVVLSGAASGFDQKVSFSDSTPDTLLEMPAITPGTSNARLVVLAGVRYGTVASLTTGTDFSGAGMTRHLDLRSSASTAPQWGGVAASKALTTAGVTQAAENATYEEAAMDIGWLLTVAPATTSSNVTSAPRNPRRVARTSTTITVAWDAPATIPAAHPVTSYQVLNGSGTVLGTVSGTVLTFQDTGLTPSTTYTYKVVAINDAGTSPASATITVTTPAVTTSRLPGDPGATKMYIGNTSGTYSEAWFDKRIFPGATSADPPTKRFVLAREYNPSSSFTLTSGMKTALHGHSAAGRIPILSSKGITQTGGTTALADIVNGLADADIDSDATFLASLGTTVWKAFVHEPENKLNSSTTGVDKTACDLYRKAYRRIISRTWAIAKNVAWFSPFYTSAIWTGPSGAWDDWRWFHPNWDGDVGVAGSGWLTNGPFASGSWVHGDGIDLYNPKLGNKLDTASRNATWENKAQQFLQRRANDGGLALPWAIGEHGIYNYLATLDDNGVTNLGQITDMLALGAGTENLVGCVFWNNSFALWDDTQDLYPTVGARTAALRSAINANLSAVVMG